jgi:pyruvate/2-oxoglutarate/acetoin dehydrogenase E1 component
MQTDVAADPKGTRVELTYRDAICAAIEDEMSLDPSVVMLGEDVGAAGGVFKTSVGLFEKFGPQRLIDTPICENGFMGVALGMAVTGMRPVVEIMFSDFLPTSGDSIVNELPKFRFMSGGQSEVPITVRSIAGATGRFGTQHSATGESWYMSLPGLKVASAGSPASAYGVLRAAIRDNNPVLFFEHKGLYNRKGWVDRELGAAGGIDKAKVLREGSDITVVATLLMVDRALTAATALAPEGIDAEVIDLRWLRPLDVDSISRSVGKTGRLLIVEEQVHNGGWGASLISQLTMSGIRWEVAPRALSLPDNLLIPYSPVLEDAIIPSSEAIALAIKSVLRR